MSEHIKHISKEKNADVSERRLDANHEGQITPNEVQSEKEHQKELATEARKELETTASSSKDKIDQLNNLDQADKPPIDETRLSINNELLEIVKRRELKNIQRQHTAAKQTLSKVIHQPTISIISEYSSKTITRPSGLLGGSVVALIGTSIYYYLSKHIGFQYNYFIVFILFICGFLLGTLVELFLYILSRKNSLE